MGLGASNLIKTPKSVVTDKDGKELMLVKGVCAKIIGGQHKGIYCEVCTVNSFFLFYLNCGNVIINHLLLVKQLHYILMFLYSASSSFFPRFSII